MIFIDYQNIGSAAEFEKLVAAKQAYLYFKYLEWDSSFFGRPCFLLDMDKSNFEQSDMLVNAITAKFNESFISAKINTQYDYEIIYFLQKCGFYYVDTEIELRFNSNVSTEYKNLDVFVEEKMDNIGLPYDELGSVFELTRFHTDININNKKADELWISYLKNYKIDGGHRMFVAYFKQKPCGVILVNSVGDRATVFFVSVLSGFRDKNVGSAMMQYALHSIGNQNIYTETQVKNISALNFYIKNGFGNISKTTTVMHRWG